MRIKIKEAKNKFALLFLYIVILLVLWVLDVPCIFKTLTGLECLGCGMSRAVLALLKLDFYSAFKYHPMVFSLPILLIYYLFDIDIIKPKFINYIILVAVALGFITNWLCGSLW